MKRTREYLIEFGARIFMIMQDPEAVPLKSDDERKVMMIGYNNARHKWALNNKKKIYYNE